MPSITAEAFAGLLALIGVVIVVSALLSGLVERTNFPQAAVFLLLGALLGPYGVGVLHIGLDSPVLRVVGTLSLALVLFVDALTLNYSEVRKHAGLAATILGPGTMLAAGIIGFGANRLLGLSPPLSAILAAGLASTDPVLLRGLLRAPSLPARTRLALRLESGLNDVVLLPIVLAAMTLLGSEHSGPGKMDIPKLLFQMLVLGPAAGAGIAAIGIGTLIFVRKRVGVRRDYESLYSLGICFAAFAAAESVHSSGFLAAFAAGATIAALDVELCDCFHEYGETTAELLLLFTFVLLGASLIWSGLGSLTIAVGLFAVVALVARPLSILATLAPMKIESRARNLIAWFGPRGLSTLLLILVPIFAGTPGSRDLFGYASVVVLISIALHGFSMMGVGAGTPTTHKAAELVTPAELDRLRAEGKQVWLLDARSEKSFSASPDLIKGSLRIDPHGSVASAEALGIPRDAWPALFCT